VYNDIRYTLYKQRHFREPKQNSCTSHPIATYMGWKSKLQTLPESRGSMLYWYNLYRKGSVYRWQRKEERKKIQVIQGDLLNMLTPFFR